VGAPNFHLQIVLRSEPHILQADSNSI